MLGPLGPSEWIMCSATDEFVSWPKNASLSEFAM